MTRAISVENLSKLYRVDSQRVFTRSMRETVMAAVAAPWSRLRRLVAPSPNARHSAQRDAIWALKDVSFSVQSGELVGIIGQNGAGKSTLLKIIGRITGPTEGHVELRGRVGSLLEVGTGFHQELTGRENIYLNGAILGMRHREIAQRFDEIVAFAEVEQFIDTPVKRYSSGMYMRLAFAVAANLFPDILLIDEVLAVGDLRFQRKCMEHAKGLQARSATMLLVSHNMFAIKATCSRVIYLSKGGVRFDGPPEEAIRLYEQESRLTTPSWAQEIVGANISQPPIRFIGVEVFGENEQPRTVFDYGERMRVRLHYEAMEAVNEPSFNISFMRSDNIACCSYNTVMDGCIVSSVRGKGAVEVLTPPLKLVSEIYTIQMSVWDRAYQHLYCAQLGPTFHVRHHLLSTHFGVFHEPGQWLWKN